MWFVKIIMNLIEGWKVLLHSKPSKHNYIKCVKIEDINRLKEKVRKIKNNN